MYDERRLKPQRAVTKPAKDRRDGAGDRDKQPARQTVAQSGQPGGAVHAIAGKAKKDTAPVVVVAAGQQTAAQAKLSKTRRRRELRKKQRAAAGNASAGDAAPSDGVQQTASPMEAEKTEALRLKPPSKKKRKREAHAAETDTAGAAASGDVAQQCVDVHAWARFRLHAAVTDGLSRLGFAAPTAVQAAVLPVALHQGRDIIGAAETGSGKTLAFGLPILHHLATRAAHADDVRQLTALILCPTRELAMQVSAHIQAAGACLPTGGKAPHRCCVALVGGLAPQKQARLLAAAPPIVVATPGRLWELVSSGEAHLQRLDLLRFLVLDEADRMIEKGHYAELTSILAAVESFRGDGDTTAEPESAQKRQTFVFSATLVVPQAFRQRLTAPGASLQSKPRRGGNKQGTVSALLERVPFTGSPAVIDCTDKARPVASRVLEAAFEGTEEERDAALFCILSQYPGRTLVFCNAISCVRRVAALLDTLQVPSAALHASQQQRQRLKALDRFSAAGDAESGTSFALVATDVAARGLDIPGVRTVVHYQVAPSAEIYVHRCGRTARGITADGAAVTLVTPSERTRYVALCKATGNGALGLPRLPLDPAALKASHRRCILARKLDALQHARRKAQGDSAWRKRNAEELGLELSDDDGDADDANEPGDGQTASEKELRTQLADLLAVPLGGLSRAAQGGTRKFPTFTAPAAQRSSGKVSTAPGTDMATVLKAKRAAAGKPPGSGERRLKKRRLAASMRAGKDSALEEV